MQYLGGKSRVAKHIAKVLTAHATDHHTYVEPFLGGGSVFAEVARAFPRALAADASLDLVLMWRAVLDGWDPPEALSEEEYRSLRRADPSPLRAVAGFGCSFGGKWFGGYARHKPGAKSYAAMCASSLRAKRAKIGTADVRHGDYRELASEIGPGVLVYCDPPYENTTGYGAVASFDTAAFHTEMERWTAAGATVYVSEYSAPLRWPVAWEASVNGTLRGGTDRKVTERLYRVTPAKKGTPMTTAQEAG